MSESVTTLPSTAGTVRIAVAGELDLDSGGDLSDAVDRAFRSGGARRVVVDLAGVTFIDSSGLQRLAWLGTRRTADQELLFVRPSEATRRVIDMTGLAGRLTIVSEDDL